MQTGTNPYSQNESLTDSNLQIGRVVTRKLLGLQFTDLPPANLQIADPHFRIIPDEVVCQ